MIFLFSIKRHKYLTAIRVPFYLKNIVYFMLLTLSGRSFIKIKYSSLPLFPVVYPFRIETQLQYYVKREKCKVSDVTFPSECEARTINLGKKNVNIGIFTGATSVRSKNIFTCIFRCPTRKHEIRFSFLISIKKYKYLTSLHFLLKIINISRQYLLLNQVILFFLI